MLLATVLETGIEPARSCEHMVLNHARLPIPPPELYLSYKKRVKIKGVFLMVQGFHVSNSMFQVSEKIP